MTELGLNDRRDGEERRNRDAALRRFRDNGAVAEWVRFLTPLLLAAIVAYFTTVTKLAVLEERQRNQYEEVIRMLNLLREDVRIHNQVHR